MAAEYVWHVAGEWDEHLGQLCSRCGMVLDDGNDRKAWPVGQDPPKGWEPGARILTDRPVVPDGRPAVYATEDCLDPDRDRSDETECESVVGVP